MRTKKDNLMVEEVRTAATIDPNYRQERLQALAKDVTDHWLVQEKPILSVIPIFGRLVTFIRERVNNVSTRWYVKQILQQQVDFNAAVTRAINELSREVAYSDSPMEMYSAVTKQKISELEAQIDSEFAKIDQRLSKIENKLRNVTGN